MCSCEVFENSFSRIGFLDEGLNCIFPFSVLAPICRLRDLTAVRDACLRAYYNKLYYAFVFAGKKCYKIIP